MRLLWLLCISNSFLAACERDVVTNHLDTLKKFRVTLQSKKSKRIYPLKLEGNEPLESRFFMTPLLKKLKEENQQDQTNEALQSCMISTVAWPIKRQLIAGTIFAGADPNIDHPTINPLIRACRAQDFALITFLCQKGATVTFADACHTFKKILCDVQKYKIAAYLIERGAALSNGMPHESSLLHDRTVLDAQGSWRLVPLYLSKGLAVTSRFENVFHCLASHAYRYHNDVPKMLKKFNAIVTHLTPEQTLQLLQARDGSYRLLPEEMCTMKSPVGTTPYFLAHVMKQKRELLEQALANSKKES